MRERLHFVGQPRELSVGEFFKPFDTEIPPLKFEDEKAGGRTLAVFEFTLGGIEGRFCLFREGLFLSNEYDARSDFSTNGVVFPLGTVREALAIWGDGKIHIEDAISTLGVHFMAHSEEETKTLDRHVIEVTIGEKKFYISPKFDHGEDLEKALKFVREHGWEEAVDKVVLDESGKEVSVWLPYAPSKLREIEARFIERPEFK